MPYVAAQDLRGKHPVRTKEILVTTDGWGMFDGTGSQLVTVNITASNAVSASYEVIYETSGSYSETASIANTASFSITSSYISTASWARNAVTSSYISTSSFSLTVPSNITCSNLLVTSILRNGEDPSAIGIFSHAEGGTTIANGNYSHAEGGSTTSSGSYSHAEGFNNMAMGDNSHAEGGNTLTKGDSAHAEGGGTEAHGAFSHAEGLTTFAIGQASHTGGTGTIASGSYQTVIGKYNTQNNTSSLLIIGSGVSLTSRTDLALFNSGSIIFNQPLTASVQGTSSWANNSVTSSFVSASNVQGGVTQEVYFAGQSFTTMSFVKGILIAVI